MTLTIAGFRRCTVGCSGCPRDEVLYPSRNSKIGYIIYIMRKNESEFKNRILYIIYIMRKNEP